MFCFSPYRLFCAAVLAGAATYAAEVGLRAQADRQKIYLGESFNLTVEVSGEDSAIETPRIAADGEITLLGSQNQSRSMVSVINGRMTRDEYKGRTFTFRIRPKSAGRFETGAVTAVVGGRSYSAPGAAVEVTGVQRQTTVLAAVKASTEAALIDESFTVTLSFDVKALPGKFSASEPLHPEYPPKIESSFLGLNFAPDGLKVPNLQEKLNGLISRDGRQPSFAINDYASQPGFGGFGMNFDDMFKPKAIPFRLQPEKIKIGTDDYFRYTLTLAYTPEKLGSYTFGPVTFKGRVVTAVAEDGQATLTDVFTIAPAATVRVTPPPEEGRPKSFIGAVGRNMTASAELDTSICKTGDPLTLTVTVRGQVNASTISVPDLSKLGLKDFRLYEETMRTETLPDGRRFKFRLRPLKSGTLEFPSLELGYFNTQARRYETLRTAPIPLQVSATAQIAAAEARDEDERPLPSGLFWSFPKPPAPVAVSRPLLIFPPIVFGLVCLAPLVVRRARDLRANLKKSGAARKALAQLRRAESPSAIRAAVCGWLAVRLNRPGHALTPMEVRALLLGAGVPEAQANELGGMLEALDACIYSGAAAPADPARTLAPLILSIDTALTEEKEEPDEAS